MAQSWLARALDLFRKPSPSTAIVKPTNELETISQFMVNRPVGRDDQGADLYTLMDEGYRRNVIVYVCVNEIAQSAAAPRIYLRDRKTQKEVEEHELLDLFARPAPGLSRYDLFEQLLIHQQTAGAGYLHKGRNSAGQIIQLKTARPDRLQPVPDKQGNVLYYEYKIESEPAVRVEVEDIAQFRLPDPLNDFHGLSPLQVCAIFGDIDTAAAIYLRDFFANGAMPMGLLKFKMPTVRREDRLRVQAEWEETYGGGASRTVDARRSRWHNVGVIGADVEFQPIASEPAQLRLDAVWGMTETRICSTFGVPPSIVQARIGMQFSTYSNMREARRSFWTETLVPIYARLGDGLTRTIVAEHDEDLELVFDVESIPELQEDLNQRADRATKLFLSGIASFNEARELSDLEEAKVDFYAHPGTVTMVPREDLEGGKYFKDKAEMADAAKAGLAKAAEDGGNEEPPFGKKPPKEGPPKEGPPPKEGQSEDEHGLPFEVLGLGTMPEESEPEILKATETLDAGFSEAVREAIAASDPDALKAALAGGDWRAAEKAIATDVFVQRYSDILDRHLRAQAELALRMHYRHHVGEPRETHADGHWVTIKGHPVFIGGPKGGGGGGGGGAAGGVFTSHPPTAAPGGVKMASGQPPTAPNPQDLRPLNAAPLPVVNFKGYDPKLSTPAQAAQLEATRKHVLDVYADPQVAIPRAAWDGLKGIELRPAAAYPKKGITGYYERDKQRLTVIAQDKHLSRNTPIHELGHHVHMAKLTEAASNEWADISKGGKACKISNYGRTNTGEHFAEAFRNYADVRSPSKPGFLAPRDWLKKQEPKTYDFFARLWSDASMWYAPGKLADYMQHQKRYKGGKV